MIYSEALDIIRRSAARERLPHAYLILADPRGEGIQLVRDIAALLLCPEVRNGSACGTCKSCQMIQKGIHADVQMIEPEKKSRIIGVEAMKDEFLKWASMKSFYGGWKIGVVLFADRLNDSSSNAFLKTLEEPPENTLFLLVTDRPDTLLTTIISRCQRIDLSRGHQRAAEPWSSQVAEILSKHSNASTLRVMATSARLSGLFSEMKEIAESDVEARVEALREQGQSVEAETVKSLVSAREKELRRAVFLSMQDWYRDLLLLCSVSPEDAGSVALCYPEYEKTLRDRAKGLAPRIAMRYIEFVQKIEQQMEVRSMKSSTVLPYWFNWLK